MKYEIDLVPKNNGSKTVDVEANSFDEAVKIAQAENSEYNVTCVGEILSDDEEEGREIGECREVWYECECCEKIIFDVTLYVVTEDGCHLCKECANEL